MCSGLGNGGAGSFAIMACGTLEVHWMRYRRLGRSDLEVSVVSLGTWAFGGVDFGPVDELDARKTIFRALDFGVNLFDTAPIYGNGRAEEVLGKALEGLRKDVFLATKCGPVEVRPGLVRLDLSRTGIESQLDQSLRRLRTDYVDLLQIHWADPASPIEEAVGTLMRMVEKGKVRCAGVSNFDLEQMHRATSSGEVVSLQSEYSLLEREVEQEVLPFCEEHEIGFLAYSPLAMGLLSGRYDVRRKLAPTDVRTRDPRFRGRELELRLERVEQLARLARREGIPTATLAVAWVVSQRGVSSAIVGAKNPRQLVENLQAADLELDVETLERAARTCVLDGARD